MRFSVAAAAALVAGASATTYSNVSTVDTPVYTTEVVTAYTTYCPEATSIVHNNVTYTVTSATTLTITNCPCTITKPLSSATVTYCPTTTPAAPVIPSAPVYTNATVPPPATSGVASSSVAPAPIASFTAGANKAFAASGAGLAGLLGLAAYIL